jgi:alpha-ribazole phosphatase
MRLIVIRHGESVYNDQKRFTGQADVPLSPLGKRQAAALGERLAGEHLDAIVSSDLLRARDTAEAIASYHALPVYEDSDLRELALGEWEGLTYAEVLARDADRLAQWRADPTTFTPPGGESVATLRDRITCALERWQSRCPQGSVVWVTHGGLIGVLLCHVLEMDLKRRWQFRHENASIHELELRGERVIIARLNDTAHVPRKGDESDTAD